MERKEHTFCRASLKLARKHATKKVPKLYPWLVLGDYWEVRDQQGEVIWRGKAHCAYDAKANCITDKFTE